MTEHTKNIINKIIECGRSGLYSDLESLFPNWRDYKSFIDQIHSEIRLEGNEQFLHYYETFNRLSEKYDFDSLLNLIKGLTIIENGHKQGSVSPVIAFYKKLIEKAGLFYLTTGDKQGIYLLIRSLEQNPNTEIENLTHWILKNSENPYLPFGTSTLISKTIPDIKIEVENWFQRQKETSAREKQEREDKKKREELRKEQAAENIKIHNAKKQSEREYRQSLSNLSNNELLTLISNDKKRPIYYYSNELIRMNKLKPNEKELLNKIIVELGLNETKQSKRLKKQLLKIIEK
jgi:hypothetical protein